MPNNYVLLQRVEVGAAGAASISFTNIPQTGYTDLKVVASSRNNSASIAVLLQFNGDTGNNYSWRRIQGAGSGTPTSSSSSSVAQIDGALSSGSGDTASTFGSTEFYIPNYAGNQNKSISVDSVSENNGTTAYSRLSAGLWSAIAAINSIKLYPDASGSFVQFSTFSLYAMAAVGVTPTVAPKASGGSITTDGTYWIHTFRSSGNFVLQTTLSCDYLVIAGGGGGGGDVGGGGGAGGLRSTVTSSGGSPGTVESALTLQSGNYNILVGGGGGAGGLTSLNNGSNSVFSTITSIGGGGGGDWGTYPKAASIGGSGGGGRYDQTSAAAGTANQGFAGGAGGAASNYGGGGGGGAGSAGTAGTSDSGGNGGSGRVVAISGSSVSYAGGAPGGTLSAFNLGSGDGVSGAGSGYDSDGRPYTGSGGVGAFTSNELGGNGGSGIVILRYLVA